MTLEKLQKEIGACYYKSIKITKTEEALFKKRAAYTFAGVAERLHTHVEEYQH